MTLAQKYSFTFYALKRENPIVQRFLLEHLRANNYPLDLEPSSEKWCGVAYGPTFYCVFGWRRLPKSIDVPDFYTHPGRWGVLAGYAALERIKADADVHHVPVVTVTPYHNTRMVDAYKRVFGVDEPSHLVYVYNPPGKVPDATELPHEEVSNGG